jgi:hypothetical protein
MAQQPTLQWLHSPGLQGPALQGAEMIQLATDPQASRSNWRPAGEAKENSLATPRRSGHAWPFISRYGEQPAPQDSKRTPSTDESGS